MLYVVMVVGFIVMFSWIEWGGIKTERYFFSVEQ